jgi:hypothetical protein
MLHTAFYWDGILERLTEWESDMRIVNWNVRNLCGSSLLKTVSRELAECKLDSVDVQEIRSYKGDTKLSEDFTFIYGNCHVDHNLGSGFSAHEGNVSALKG